MDLDDGMLVMETDIDTLEEAVTLGDPLGDFETDAELLKVPVPADVFEGTGETLSDFVATDEVLAFKDAELAGVVVAKPDGLALCFGDADIEAIFDDEGDTVNTAELDLVAPLFIDGEATAEFDAHEDVLGDLETDAELLSVVVDLPDLEGDGDTDIVTDNDFDMPPEAVFEFDTVFDLRVEEVELTLTDLVEFAPVGVVVSESLPERLEVACFDVAAGDILADAAAVVVIDAFGDRLTDAAIVVDTDAPIERLIDAVTVVDTDAVIEPLSVRLSVTAPVLDSEADAEAF